ncbi:MAG: cyclic nucleotide-binding domain-containing protein [Ignavibacteriaceae bacterium]
MPKSSTMANTEFRSYDQGEFIFVEGDPGNTMFSILEGKVEIRAHDKTVYIAGPGEILGEMALIENKPRSATVVAKTKCKLAVIDERRFQFLLQQTPMFITQILKALADRLRHMNEEK